MGHLILNLVKDSWRFEQLLCNRWNSLPNISPDAQHLKESSTKSALSFPSQEIFRSPKMTLSNRCKMLSPSIKSTCISQSTVTASGVLLDGSKCKIIQVNIIFLLRQIFFLTEKILGLPGNLFLRPVTSLNLKLLELLNMWKMSAVSKRL